MSLHHGPFLIIPAFITDDPDIDDSTAILFGRIMALSNQKNHCWASDQYLADLTRVSIREIKYRLKVLEDKGYIIRETKKNGFGWERKIYCVYNQIESTKGMDVPLEGAHATPSEGNTCAQDIYKHNKISENNNKEGCCSSKEEKIKAMQDLGLAKTAIDNALIYSLEAIQQAIDYVRRSRDVNDLNGLFTAALKKGWIRKPSEEEKKQQQQQKEEEEEEQKRQEKVMQAKKEVQALLNEWKDKLQDGYSITEKEVTTPKWSHGIGFGEEDVTYLKAFIDRYKK